MLKNYIAGIAFLIFSCFAMADENPVLSNLLNIRFKPTVQAPSAEGFVADLSTDAGEKLKYLGPVLNVYHVYELERVPCPDDADKIVKRIRQRPDVIDAYVDTLAFGTN